ncbi:MAG: 2-C-methyl-D-erythritol 4-phosphate cytidylyltransferase [Calditerrivibrio sp.]|nr:2-C-methyl-D-erythritol 4-phosphate cytidylyltransferase [Calditerrivibrio sp.]
MSLSIIIPAGGIGKRFSKKEKKQFYKFAGKEIIYHTLLRLKSVDAAEFIIGCSDDDYNVLEDILNDLGIKNYSFAPAGQERQHTVYNCIIRAHSDFVLIHDAVRPFLSKIIIDRMLEHYSKYYGIVCGIKVKDTVKMISDNIVDKTIDRNKLYLIHTPQVFNRNILLRCLKELNDRGIFITDESMALEFFGYEVGFVESEWYNIKITTKEDLHLAEYILMYFDMLAGG